MKGSAMIKKTAAAAIALFATGLSTAAWDREPTDVLGIKLGAPLQASAIKDCPQSEWMNKYRKLTEFCIWHAMGDGSYRQIEAAPIPFASSGSVMISNQVVEAVFLELLPADYEVMLQTLIKRYGEPTGITTRQLRLGNGAQINSRQASWEGAAVAIKLNEHASTVRRAQVGFIHKPTLELRRESKDRVTDNAASRL